MRLHLQCSTCGIIDDQVHVYTQTKYQIVSLPSGITMGTRSYRECLSVKPRIVRRSRNVKTDKKGRLELSAYRKRAGACVLWKPYRVVEMVTPWCPGPIVHWPSNRGGRLVLPAFSTCIATLPLEILLTCPERSSRRT